MVVPSIKKTRRHCQDGGEAAISESQTSLANHWVTSGVSEPD